MNISQSNILFYVKLIKVKVKLATVVQGDPKAPFSITTTMRCVRGGANHFSGLLHFTLDTDLILLSKEVSCTILKVFGMTRPGIEPRSPSPLTNTLPTGPMSRFN